MKTMNHQFAVTAILETLLNKLVKLGVISEMDRFEIYSDTAEAVSAVPGVDVDMPAELIMMADRTISDDGEFAR